MNRTQELIEDFQYFDNWEEKYEFIIDIGKDLAPMPDAFKTDATKVQGCMSQVWIIANYDGDKVFFQADSDAIIVKGLIGVLMRLFNGATRQQIIDTNIQDVLKQIGLDTNLAGTRRNGLASMIKRIKQYAST